MENPSRSLPLLLRISSLSGGGWRLLLGHPEARFVEDELPASGVERVFAAMDRIVEERDGGDHCHPTGAERIVALEREMARALAPVLERPALAFALGEALGHASSAGRQLVLAVECEEEPGERSPTALPWELIAPTTSDLSLEHVQPSLVVRRVGGPPAQAAPVAEGLGLWCPQPDDPVVHSVAKRVEDLLTRGDAAPRWRAAGDQPGPLEPVAVLTAICHGEVGPDGVRIQLGEQWVTPEVLLDRAPTEGVQALLLLICHGAEPEGDVLGRPADLFTRYRVPLCVAPRSVLPAAAACRFLDGFLPAWLRGDALGRALRAGRGAMALDPDPFPEPGARPHELLVLVRDLDLLRADQRQELPGPPVQPRPPPSARPLWFALVALAVALVAVVAIGSRWRADRRRLLAAELQAKASEYQREGAPGEALAMLRAVAAVDGSALEPLSVAPLLRQGAASLVVGASQQPASRDVPVSGREGGCAVTLGAEGQVRIWDPSSGDSFLVSERGGSLPCLEQDPWAWYRDPEHRLHVSNRGRPWFTSDGAVQDVALLPDLEIIAYSDQRAVLNLVDLAQRSPETQPLEGVFGCSDATFASLQAHGSRLAVICGAVSDRPYLGVIYDIAQGEIVSRLAQPTPGFASTARAEGLLWSPGGDRIAGSSVVSQQLWVWDAATGMLVTPPRPLEERPHQLAFTSSGHRLAVSMGLGRVGIWRVADLQQIAELQDGQFLQGQPVFLPHQPWVATGGGEQVVRLFSLEDGRLSRRLTGHRAEISTLWTANTEPRLWSHSMDGSLRGWFIGPETGLEPVWVRSVGEGVVGLQVSDGAEDDRLFIATRSGVQVRTLGDGALRSSRTSRTLEQFRFVDRTGGHLLGWNGQGVWVEEEASGVRTWESPLLPERASVSASGRWARLELPDRLVLVDLHRGEPHCEIEGLAVWPGGPAFTPDERGMLVLRMVGGAATLSMVDLPECQTRWVRAIPSTRHLMPVDIDATGLKIALSSIAMDIELIDAGSGETLWRRPAHDDLVHDLAFSPDGGLLAAGSFDGTASLWSVDRGQRLHHLVPVLGDPSQADADAIAFSPQGDWIATAHAGGRVCLWDPRTGALLQLFEALTGSIRTLVFHPHRPLLLAGDSDGHVALWDLGSLGPIPTSLAATGALSNLRVCRDAGEPRAVPVTPYPAPQTVWAPEQACR